MGPPSWQKKEGLVREGGREWSGRFQEKKSSSLNDWARRRRRGKGELGLLWELVGKVTVLTVALTPFPSPEIVASAPYPTLDTVAPAPCPTPDRVFPAPVGIRVSISRRSQFRERRRIKKKGKEKQNGSRGKISPLATPFPTPLTSLFPIAFPVSFTVFATSPTAESVVRLILWTVSFVNFPTFVVASLEVCVAPAPA